MTASADGLVRWWDTRSDSFILFSSLSSSLLSSLSFSPSLSLSLSLCLSPSLSSVNWYGSVTQSQISFALVLVFVLITMSYWDMMGHRVRYKPHPNV